MSKVTLKRAAYFFSMYQTNYIYIKPFSRLYIKSIFINVVFFRSSTWIHSYIADQTDRLCSYISRTRNRRRYDCPWVTENGCRPSTGVKVLDGDLIANRNSSAQNTKRARWLKTNDSSCRSRESIRVRAIVRLSRERVQSTRVQPDTACSSPWINSIVSMQPNRSAGWHLESWNPRRPISTR